MEYWIRLRPFDRVDFLSLVRWSFSPEILVRWSGPEFDFPLDERQLETYLKQHQDNPSAWMFTAVQAQCGEPVGHIGLRNVNRRAGYGRIMDVLVDPSLHKKGIGTQMIYSILDFGFFELGLHRIDLGVYDTNPGAISFYTKVGFTKEGISREVLKVGDQYWNMHQMSMLRPEWDLTRNAAASPGGGSDAP